MRRPAVLRTPGEDGIYRVLLSGEYIGHLTPHGNDKWRWSYYGHWSTSPNLSLESAIEASEKDAVYAQVIKHLGEYTVSRENIDKLERYHLAGEGDLDSIRENITQDVVNAHHGVYSERYGGPVPTPAEIEMRLAAMDRATQVRSEFLGRSGYGFSDKDAEYTELGHEIVYDDDTGRPRWRKSTRVRYPDGSENIVKRTILPEDEDPDLDDLENYDDEFPRDWSIEGITSAPVRQDDYFDLESDSSGLADAIREFRDARDQEEVSRNQRAGDHGLEYRRLPQTSTYSQRRGRGQFRR